MGIQKRKRYSKEFKRETVLMVLGENRNVREVADELGINKYTVYQWVKDFQDDPKESFPGKGKQKASEAELTRLRREIESLKEDKEILKKALNIFSGGRR